MEEVPLNPVLMGGFLCRNNTCSKSGKSNEITWFREIENRSGLNKESFKFKKNIFDAVFRWFFFSILKDKEVDSSE